MEGLGLNIHCLDSTCMTEVHVEGKFIASTVPMLYLPIFLLANNTWRRAYCINKFFNRRINGIIFLCSAHIYIYDLCFKCFLMKKFLTMEGCVLPLKEPREL